MLHFEVHVLCKETAHMLNIMDIDFASFYVFHIWFSNCSGIVFHFIILRAVFIFFYLTANTLIFKFVVIITTAVRDFHFELKIAMLRVVIFWNDQILLEITIGNYSFYLNINMNNHGKTE